VFAGSRAIRVGRGFRGRRVFVVIKVSVGSRASKGLVDFKAIRVSVDSRVSRA
jgi:hypothetical protein